MQYLVDPPYRGRHQDSADQQRLNYTNKKRLQLHLVFTWSSLKFHLGLTQSEKVFLNFHTLGAATAKQ